MRCEWSWWSLQSSNQLTVGVVLPALQWCRGFVFDTTEGCSSTRTLLEASIWYESWRYRAVGECEGLISYSEHMWKGMKDSNEHQHNAWIVHEYLVSWARSTAGAIWKEIQLRFDDRSKKKYSQREICAQCYFWICVRLETRRYYGVEEHEQNREGWKKPFGPYGSNIYLHGHSVCQEFESRTCYYEQTFLISSITSL